MDPENPTTDRKISRFLAQHWNHYDFGWFSSKFGCHGNSLCFLKKFWQHIWIYRPRKPYHTRKNCLHILYKTEICAILAYFCL